MPHTRDSHGLSLRNIEKLAGQLSKVRTSCMTALRYAGMSSVALLTVVMVYNGAAPGSEAARASISRLTARCCHQALESRLGCCSAGPLKASQAFLTTDSISQVSASNSNQV